MNITHLVKGTFAEFVCYRDGDLWYRIVPGTNTPPVEFQFPVPVSDTGTGIFFARVKSITLMRWIRKHMERKAEWSKSEG